MTQDKKPEFSRTTKIFFKTCLVLMCLTVAIPLIVIVGYGIGEVFASIFSGLHYVFVEPFFRPNNELGIWGNIYTFSPYLLAWFGFCCLGPFGIIIGAIILLIGICLHVGGALYYLLMGLPVAAYMIVGGMLDTPVLGVIAAAIILAVTIPCWGMIAMIGLK